MTTDRQTDRQTDKRSHSTHQCGASPPIISPWQHTLIWWTSS